MILEHFFVPKIAHSSYMLQGNRSCAVIDPARDAEMYLAAAEKAGLRITLIIETHLHADFLSGHMDLARMTGAEIVAPASADCGFPHRAVSEGDSFMLEDIRFRVIETPGHTPEHVSYVVTDTSRGDCPVGVFCGDTLFVGDAGRPDLFPGRAEELAHMLFHSLVKLRELPDHCEVWPAHGAGSLCGRAVGAKYTSTIGYEKLYNGPFNMEENELVRSLTADMPQAPDHFSRCSEINRKGPRVTLNDPPVPALTAEQFHELRGSEEAIVVDLRCCDAFAALHVPGSLNISVQGNFPTFAGWVIEPGSNLFFVADSAEQAMEATRGAAMVGEFGILGYMPGGLFSWSLRKFPVAQFPLILDGCLRDMLKSDERVQLVDVRGVLEFAGGTIKGAVNIPAPDIRTRFDELDPGTLTVLFCSSGHRSSMAASLLEARGFKKLAVHAGGLAGWELSIG